MSTAKDKGTRFERSIADYLELQLEDDRIDRSPLRGTRDRGDIAGLRFAGEKVVLELKNHNRLNLAGWVDEAKAEQGNADAILSAVVHKRRGTADPGEQYVTMTVDDLITLLLGGVK